MTLDLIRQLLDALRGERPLAWCRLVETRGSTPQKAGAAMLVYQDGSQAGTLGGGCVEAEVKRRALAILESAIQGKPQSAVADFQLDNDYGWDDGLICGGRMQVLIQPLTRLADAAYFERLSELHEQRDGFTEAIVFDAKKSALVAPACYLFAPDGTLVAADGPLAPPASDYSIDAHGQGFAPAATDRAPSKVREGLAPLSSRPRASAWQGISYLPVLPRCRLLIVGGGHIGHAVGNMAADLEFDVWVVDDREEYLSRTRFPLAQRLICGEIGPTLRDLEITPNTYAIIVTRGHNHDEEALFQLVDRGARYVGLIGSRRKIKLIFDDLEAEGVSTETLAKVYAPLGIDIGSRTVPEISVSIVAELIAHRNLDGQVPGRPTGILASEGSV